MQQIGDTKETTLIFFVVSNYASASVGLRCFISDGFFVNFQHTLPFQKHWLWPNHQCHC
ncbi:MAG: hypothetical protein JWR87_400 [Segetibacter sp.]|nr:hypothetical protein [Segetibacter sp.]